MWLDSRKPFFAKCEFASENAKTNLSSIATFAKQYMEESIHYNYGTCERKLENVNFLLLRFFAKGKLGVAPAYCGYFDIKV